MAEQWIETTGDAAFFKKLEQKKAKTEEQKVQEKIQEIKYEHEAEKAASYMVNNNMNMDFSGIIDALQQQQMYSAQQANDMFEKQQKLIQDSVAANNAFAADQAKQQMDFQSRETEAQRAFNASQAVIDREFQQQSANEAMAFSSAEAQANRDWQEYMSSTAHQREMADLQAAGLNPILAANNGAAMGAGAVASSSAAAGSRASSVNAPSGAKANGDQSGTMALISVLGKMLDNSTEIQKMITSAETARATAELYTGATKYAAQLAAAANRYGSDMQYEIAGMNPWNVVGDQLGDIFDALADNGITVRSGADVAGNFASSVAKAAGAKVRGNSGVIGAVKATLNNIKETFDNAFGKSKANNNISNGYSKVGHKSGKF